MHIELTTISEENIPASLKKLDSAISNSELRHFILDAFEKKLVAAADKANGYYDLRDRIIPNLIGVQESKALFWVLINGPFMINSETIVQENVSESNTMFLKYLVDLYKEPALLAKSCAQNPMGYYGSNLIFSNIEDDITTLLTITRNDGIGLRLEVEELDILSLLEQIADSYLEVRANHIIESDHDELTRMAVERIKTILDKLVEMGKEENNGNE